MRAKFHRRQVLLAALGSVSAGSGVLSACSIVHVTADGSEADQQEFWLRAKSHDSSALPPWPIDAKEATLPVGDQHLYFLDAGSGDEVVVLLHAMTGSARSWGYQIPVLTEAGYRIVAPSARGAYGTTAIMSGLGAQIEDVRLLIEHLGVPNVHLVGTAFGGMQALHFAAAHTDKVKTLTLSCTLGGIREPSYRLRQRALLQAEFMALPPEIKELGPSYRHSNPDGVTRWLELLKESSDASFKRLTPEGKRPIVESVLSSGLSYADIRQLNMPINLIFGGADLYAPPTAARLLHSQLRNSRLTIIQETGHSAYWEQPEVFNKILLEFLSGVT